MKGDRECKDERASTSCMSTGTRYDILLPRGVVRWSCGSSLVQYTGDGYKHGELDRMMTISRCGHVLRTRTSRVRGRSSQCPNKSSERGCYTMAQTK
eukprot:scaffold268689_cov41-Tisochrysis_lutea.AAC.2